MRVLVILFFSVLLVGCGSTRNNFNEKFESKKDSLYHSVYKEMYYSLRDSIGKIEAPKEASQTHGLMESYLFTSLAHSWAWIDGDGKLNHNIQNKDSIPTKYVIETKELYITDTLYINKIDTVYIRQEVEIVDELRFFEKLKNRVGEITLFGLLVFVFIAIYKKK